MKRLTAVSLFSGCGGFDLGVSNCGVDMIWANDIDYHAASAYRSLFPDVEFVHDDIRNISIIPTADVLIGCYPCTGFSEAARRKWKNRESRDLMLNPMNFLFREFLRAIDLVKPKFIFIENVRGMLSASDGYFINEQIEGIKSLGFRNVKFKLLSAEKFGVSQSRKRVFIVGTHKSVKDFEYNFPKETHGNKCENQIVTLEDVIGEMPSWPEGEFSETKFHGHYLTRNRKRNWNQPSFTVVAQSNHIPLHPMGESMVKIGDDNWELRGNENRRLSWKECAAIQGLPLSIDIDGNLNAKYKVIGNSVPPKLAEAVAKPVIEFLKG